MPLGASLQIDTSHQSMTLTEPQARHARKKTTLAYRQTRGKDYPNVQLDQEHTHSVVY